MRRIVLLLFVLLAPVTARATVFMTQQQALASAFPPNAKVERQTFFLTNDQVYFGNAEPASTFASGSNGSRFRRFSIDGSRPASCRGSRVAS